MPKTKFVFHSSFTYSFLGTVVALLFVSVSELTFVSTHSTAICLVGQERTLYEPFVYQSITRILLPSFPNPVLFLYLSTQFKQRYYRASDYAAPSDTERFQVLNTILKPQRVRYYKTLMTSGNQCTCTPTDMMNKSDGILNPSSMSNKVNTNSDMVYGIPLFGHSSQFAPGFVTEQECLTMITEYERQQGNSEVFDLVFLSRPDLAYIKVHENVLQAMIKNVTHTGTRTETNASTRADDSPGPIYTSGDHFYFMSRKMASLFLKERCESYNRFMRLNSHLIETKLWPGHPKHPRGYLVHELGIPAPHQQRAIEFQFTRPCQGGSLIGRCCANPGIGPTRTPCGQQNKSLT